MLGASFVSRRAIRMGEAEAVYIVGRAKDEVVTKTGDAFFVQPGLFKMKVQEGARHPFLRALTADGAPVLTILDATLGFANDALHAAAGTGARVTGVEQGPVMQCLLEEGLPRLARGAGPLASAAARIELVRGEAGDVLRGLPAGAVDVVSLDPMMSRPKLGHPGMEPYRAFAITARATDDLLREALRVARCRVVLKLGKGAPRPPALPWTRVVPGAHVVYLVCEAQ